MKTGILRQIAALLIGALLLSTVGLLQGKPSVFYDTDDYYLHGRMIAESVGLRPPAEAFDPERGVSIVLGRMHPDPRLAFTWYGARSAYYSAAFYGLERFATLWAVVAAQALSSALVLMWMAQAVSPERWLRTYALLVTGLVLGSSLPFFVSFAMPDVFAGLTLALAGLLIVYGDQMSRRRRMAAFALLVAGMVFHRSHVLDGLAVGLLIAGIPAAAGLSGKDVRSRAIGVAGCAVVALALLAAADKASQAMNGVALRSPPFLAVRVLADGPGRERLREICAKGAPYALCRFKALPLDDTDDMLSSDDPRLGIFRVSPYEVRETIARQEPKFVVDAVVHHPFRQIAASLKNAAIQSGLYQVDEPLLTRQAFADHWFWRQTRLPALLDRADLCRKMAGPCIQRWPGALLRILHGLVIAAAVATIVLRSRVASGPEAPAEAARARSLSLIFIYALFINGIVCGALSGPFARYEARIVWLLPAAAILLEAAVRQASVSVGRRRLSPLGRPAAQVPTNLAMASR